MAPILIVVIVVLSDEAGLRVARPVSDAWTWTLAWSIPFAIVCATFLAVRLALAVGDRARGVKGIVRSGRIVSVARMSILAAHACVVFGLGWREVIEPTMKPLGPAQRLGSDLLAMAPTLLAFAATWWIAWDIERRVRDAILPRQLGTGVPIYPMPGRSAWAWGQVRFHLLLLLVPVVLLLISGEVVRWLLDVAFPNASPAWWHDVAVFAAAIVVFLLSPLSVRWTIPAISAPPGELRDEVRHMCGREGVAIRDLLIWQTGGQIVNAAIIGAIGRLRYLMVSDALIEGLPRDEVRAVLGHELGHVRGRHVPWLAAAFIALIVLTTGVSELALTLIDRTISHAEWWVEGAFAVGSLALTLPIFGFVSRRFERQADCAAVRHLSVEGANSTGTQPELLTNGPDACTQTQVTATPAAVHAMQSALRRVAALAGSNPSRRSWRHGSILWRIRYLETLVGLPAERLPIDRIVSRLKRLLILAFLAGVGFFAVASSLAPPPEPEPVTIGELVETISRNLREMAAE